MNPWFFSFCAFFPKSLNILFFEFPMELHWYFELISLSFCKWFCFSCYGGGENIVYRVLLSASCKKKPHSYWCSQRWLQDIHWLVIIFRVFRKAANVGTLLLTNVLLLSPVFYAQTFCTVCGHFDKACMTTLWPGRPIAPAIISRVELNT